MSSKLTQINEESIKQVVDEFYSSVRKDTFLAPIFEKVIGTSNQEWRAHLDTLYTFWSSVMLGSGRYRGSPFQKHLELPAFDIKLFDRWLELFAMTVDRIHSSDISAKYKQKSRQIAQSLKYGLY